jgi:hypothetical protein
VGVIEAFAVQLNGSPTTPPQADPAANPSENL